MEEERVYGECLLSPKLLGNELLEEIVDVMEIGEIGVYVLLLDLVLEK